MVKLLDKIFKKNAGVRKGSSITFSPKDENRMIKVRFPSMAGDETRTISIQELKNEYKDYLIIDPRVGEQVDLEKLANLDINEVIAMPPIAGG